ncbi:MAG TPA: hypothetical protein VH054_01090 [Polyangiaceae bacterium]|jgi:hypothetical protein|nr:hypothetical protein [Polyangiaceae bacterium]
MSMRVAFAGFVMMASVMCSNGDDGTPDAGDASASCELNASAACGAPGGDYAMTTQSGCTGVSCAAGEICLSSNDQLTCISLSAVCGGSAGTVQAILACKANGDCPAQMVCGSLNTCVPNCTPDAG